MTSASDFTIVCRGRIADVRLSPGANRAFDEVCAGTDARSIKRKRTLTRYFQEFCENEPHRLGEEKFKKQGNLADGVGGKVAIWEFKAWQWRLYGSILSVGGKKCFVGVKVDPDKKTDRADRTLLEAAAREISKLSEYSGTETTPGASHGIQKGKKR